MKKQDAKIYKELLLDRKTQILNNINIYNNEIKGIDASNLRDDIEIASLDDKINIGYALYAKKLKELNEINIALGKIENDEYGICEMCEEEIDTERLKVKPHAKYCIICREISEKNKNN